MKSSIAVRSVNLLDVRRVSAHSRMLFIRVVAGGVLEVCDVSSVAVRT